MYQNQCFLIILRFFFTFIWIFPPSEKLRHPRIDCWWLSCLNFSIMYLKKTERERMEKLKKAEQEKAAKEKEAAEKVRVMGSVIISELIRLGLWISVFLCHVNSIPEAHFISCNCNLPFFGMVVQYGTVLLGMLIWAWEGLDIDTATSRLSLICYILFLSAINFYCLKIHPISMPSSDRICIVHQVIWDQQNMILQQHLRYFVHVLLHYGWGG